LKYIEPQADLRIILAALRSRGKQTFLSTNSHDEWTDAIMSASLGSQWQNFFDLVLLNSRKPLFWRASAPFYQLDKSQNNL
jgi:hypothetical protein